VAERTQPRSLSRRTALRMLAAAPAALAGGAALAAQKGAESEAKPEPKPSPYARFIAKDEKDLGGKERSRLLEQMPGLEGALKKIRDFEVPPETEPALNFKAIRSTKGGRP